MINERLMEIKKRVCSFPCTVMIDIDETILNPLYRYKEEISRLMGVELTVEEIERSGGLDNYFRDSPRYDEFYRIAEQLRADEKFNSNLPVIDGAINGIRELGRIGGLCLGGYLTTRPERVIRVTEEDLQSKGLPSLPVISRPVGIPRSDTIKWKKSVLEEILEDYDGSLVYIDDSLPFAREIIARNNRFRKIIVAILFNGPLTHFEVEKKNIKSLPNDHFYVTDWKEIPFICKKYVSKAFADNNAT